MINTKTKILILKNYLQIIKYLKIFYLFFTGLNRKRNLKLFLKRIRRKKGS